MRTEKASTLSEVLHAAAKIADEWRLRASDAEEVWYRGQSRSDQQLMPSLYRKQNEGFAAVEASLIARFQNLALPLIQRSLDEWEWYFLARHHGIPTRLLDWSESLAVAVRFAISEYCSKLGDRLCLDRERQLSPKAPVFDNDSPCVWMLEAGTLNKFSAGLDLTLIPGGEHTKHYLPDSLSRTRKTSRYPIAISPPRSNPRLAAQRGAFTLHGSSSRALETYTKGVKLAKIQLDRSRLAHIAYELEIAGVDLFGLFPDLDHMAEQARWEYKQQTVLHKRSKKASVSKGRARLRRLKRYK